MKKLISMVLCFVMFASVLSAAVPVFAATASGTCGDNLAWSFDSASGTLTITGYGDMTEYSYTAFPWYQYRNQITKVSLTSDITSFCESAFSVCPSLNYNVYENGRYLGNEDDTYVVLTGLANNGGSSAYEIHENTKIIADWVFADSRVKDLTIPDGVVSIGDGAFANSRVTNIRIPAGVKKLGSTVFSNCTKLTTLVLPEGLEEIGYHAFYKCSGLTSLIISSTVKSIGDGAFFGCSSLTDVFYGGSEEEWEELEMASDVRDFFSGKNVHFNSVCGSNVTWSLLDGLLTVCGDGAMTDYDITESFAPWYGVRDRIETVNVLTGITAIGGGAFYGCDNLTGIFIPNSVEKIGKNAFSGCTSLAAVNYSGSAEEWEAVAILEGNGPLLEAGRVSAYAGTCGEELTWVFYIDAGELDIFGAGDMEDYSSVDDIPWYEYRGSVRTLYVSEGVTSVCDSAFSGFTALEDVSVPNSLERIGHSAFSGGSKTNYAVYGNLKYFGNASDPYLILVGVTNESKTSYTINDGTKFILNSVFGDCTRFKDIIIPDGVVSIGDGVFGNCTKLTSINIPKSVANIGKGLFPSCTALTSVTVDPENPVYRSDGNCIIERATGTIISGCSASVIPDDGTVLAIGDSAFANCQKLSAVTISNSVTRIGSNAFFYCRALTEIEIPDSVRSIGASAFSRCEGITSVTVPEGITELGQRLFEGCSNLESAVIPVSVKTVGPSAFHSCSSFKNIYYVGTAEQFAKISVDNSGGSNFTFLNATVLYEYNGAEPGETVIWKLDGGVLSIMGAGDMTDYETPSDAPWHDSIGSVTYVEIQPGITSVSANAFAGAVNLAVVRIPATLGSIGEDAFADCAAIERVYTGAHEADFGGTAVGEGNGDLLSAAWYFATDEYYVETSEILPFANSKNSFGKAYNVSDADFSRLCEYVKMVYKDDENKAAGVINSLQLMRETEWKGSCYGMAVVTLLDKASMIAFNENFSGAATMSEVDAPNQNASVESAINYYHISQKIPYVRSGNHTTYYNTRTNWKTGLRELVMRAQEGEPMLFCYGFGTSAHAIVIKGYREGADGSYEVIAYDNRRPAKDTVVKIDRNFNTCVVNGTEDCKYIEFTVDMGCFDYIDIDGPDNDYENFTYNTDPHGGSSEDNAEITIKAIGKVTVKNAEGETLIFEDGTYYGTMSVEDSYFTVGDGEEESEDYTFTYTVPNSSSFTFTPENSALYVSVLSSEIYASSDTDGASSVFISKDTVRASGASFSYTLSLSINDEVCDMVSVAGSTTIAVELTNKGGVIKAEGVDMTSGEVKVYSNTVNVETYSYLPGYTSFIVEEKSALAGDVRIMGQSSGGAYDVDIGRRTSECAHVWIPGETTEPTYTSDGSAVYTCGKCGEVKTEVIPKLISTVKGDIDGDGKVSVKDLLSFRRALAGGAELDEAALARADFNGDGRVNLKDVLALRRAFAEA